MPSWAQVYILDSLLTFIPQTSEDAEILAERIAVRLSANNPAVVLNTVRVVLYLMNYISDPQTTDTLCKKLGPPLGKSALQAARRYP
jgi:AP-2 complex subunit beta-1